MLYIFLIYILFFIGYYFQKESFFLNEEFLIAISMIFVFVLLIRVLSKLINFSFFLRIEQIYFLFLNLIVLNIKLIDKMLNLVKLETFRLESLMTFHLYSFFIEVSNEMFASLRILNLSFLKNFFYSFVNYLHLLNFCYLTDVFVTKYVKTNNNKLLNSFFFVDNNKTILVEASSTSLLDVLTIDDFNNF